MKQLSDTDTLALDTLQQDDTVQKVYVTDLVPALGPIPFLMPRFSMKNVL